jgi:phosphoribosylformylglycinamidine synthase
MSGSFNDLDVPPTLVSFALAPGLASLAVSPEFKKEGSQLSLVTVPRDGDQLPDFAKLHEIAAELHRLNVARKILSMKSLGSGGLMHGIALGVFGNGIGADITAPLDLYGERYFSFLIEHDSALPESLEARDLGTTRGDWRISTPGKDHDTGYLMDKWHDTLAPVYSSIPDGGVGHWNGDENRGVLEPVLRRPDRRSGSLASIAKPRVLIPTFPGTNSEYDSAKAFNEAGAIAEIQVFRNLNARQLEESLEAFAARIRESQILMFPGGFSAGDEPDGSAKFIATVIRNPRVADAIMDLLKNREGLILGICNGFQALIKTGLVPYGEIRDPDAESPTLTFNTIGRHVSCYVNTRIVSTISPWMAGMEAGQVHTLPVSHGEGRFFGSPQAIARLAAKGQITTQYVDHEGKPSMHIQHNPNGSRFAIEGITSPCGRVFGKMAHTERSGSRVAKNIPGEKHQPIFRAGVKWFE